MNTYIRKEKLEAQQEQNQMINGRGKRFMSVLVTNPTGQ
jgi:hypothetical protein